MSASERRKGDRIEREIVEAHKAIGIKSERYPLSGASHFRGSGHDVDVYLFGDEAAPAVAEVKARKEGTGFALLERWLSDFDLLFLRRDRQQPLVVLPWSTYERLISQGRRFTNGNSTSESRRAKKPAPRAQAAAPEALDGRAETG
jgi:hypothetical protein